MNHEDQDSAEREEVIYTCGKIIGMVARIDAATLERIIERPAEGFRYVSHLRAIQKLKAELQLK